jgi:uncharacterized protein (DUF983 family)
MNTDRVSPGLALMRGLRRRCPRCGNGGLFRGWFRMAPTCPSCGLRLEREEGAFLGSLALNYGMSGVLGIVVMTVWFILTLPDTNILQMMFGVIGTVLLGVAFFYPYAKTTWAALDLLTHGDQPHEHEGRDEA